MSCRDGLGLDLAERRWFEAGGGARRQQRDAGAERRSGGARHEAFGEAAHWRASAIAR
jgi:hypothetical protein